MSLNLNKSSMYALIDRLRELQKKRRVLRWIPFTSKKRAAVEAEIKQVSRIMFPPIWCESAKQWY